MYKFAFILVNVWKLDQNGLETGRRQWMQPQASCGANIYYKRFAFFALLWFYLNNPMDRERGGWVPPSWQYFWVCLKALLVSKTTVSIWKGVEVQQLRHFPCLRVQRHARAGGGAFTQFFFFDENGSVTQPCGRRPMRSPVDTYISLFLVTEPGGELPTIPPPSHLHFQSNPHLS